MALTTVSIPFSTNTPIGRGLPNAVLFDDCNLTTPGPTALWTTGVQFTLAPSIANRPKSRLVGWAVYGSLLVGQYNEAGPAPLAAKLGKLIGVLLPSGETDQIQRPFSPPIPGDAIVQNTFWDGQQQDVAIGEFRNILPVQLLPNLNPTVVSDDIDLPIPLSLASYPQVAIRLILTPSLFATPGMAGTVPHPCVTLLSATTRLTIDDG